MASKTGNFLLNWAGLSGFYKLPASRIGDICIVCSTKMTCSKSNTSDLSREFYSCPYCGNNILEYRKWRRDGRLEDTIESSILKFFFEPLYGAINLEDVSLEGYKIVKIFKHNGSIVDKKDYFYSKDDVYVYEKDNHILLAFNESTLIISLLTVLIFWGNKEVELFFDTPEKKQLIKMNFDDAMELLLIIGVYNKDFPPLGELTEGHKALICEQNINQKKSDE